MTAENALRGRPAVRAGGPRLRLLSYNIQSGMAAARYRDYVTQSWRYLVPHERRWDQLQRIARRLQGFDIVALQETDAGSLRTGHVDPTRYLALHGGFGYWHVQVNRRFGPFARHGNGLLARTAPDDTEEHALPGAPGRGVVVARFAAGPTPFAVVAAHLALGPRARRRQLDFIADLVNAESHAVLMGDLNCDADSPEMRALCAATRLVGPRETGGTFPSWRPYRRLDHVLATDAIRVERYWVPEWLHSDHRPVAAEIRLPSPVSDADIDTKSRQFLASDRHR